MSENLAPQQSNDHEQQLNEQESSVSTAKKPNAWQALWKFKGFRWSFYTLILLAIALGSGYFVLTRFFSHPAITNPSIAHEHFRIYMAINNERVNFADPAFDTPYEKDQCAGRLTNEPFHFHDNNGELVHVHWNNLTGGLFLKHYGLNLIGGNTQTLGYNMNNLLSIKPVNIHGQVLPKPEPGSKYYVYVADGEDFVQRDFNQFKSRSLKGFFGVNYADGEHTGEELLGDVAIFVQETPPTADEVLKILGSFKEADLGQCAG